MVQKTNLSKAKKFYERKAAIRQVVLNRLRQSKNVLTGSRAINRHLPDYLQKKFTQDYDILVRKGMTPQQAAKRLERALDKRFQGNYFKTTPGAYKDVVKVVTTATDGEVADFVPMPKAKPKVHTSFDGVSYAGLKYLKSKFRESLADKDSSFRHNKDKEALTRIQIFEKDNLMRSPNRNRGKSIKRKGGMMKW